MKNKTGAKVSKRRFGHGEYIHRYDHNGQWHPPLSRSFQLQLDQPDQEPPQQAAQARAHKRLQNEDPSLGAVNPACLVTHVHKHRLCVHACQ